MTIRVPLSREQPLLATFILSSLWALPLTFRNLPIINTLTIVVQSSCLCCTPLISLRFCLGTTLFNRKLEPPLADSESRVY